MNILLNNHLSDIKKVADVQVIGKIVAKPDIKNHGFGLKSVEYAVRKNGRE